MRGTVDADDIRVAEDFDESLLHRTPEIDAFLTPGPRRQVHRHRHQGLRQDALLLEGQARPLPARGPGGLPAERQACSTSRSATRSSAASRSRCSPPRRCRGRRCWLSGDRAGDAQARRRPRRPQGRRPALTAWSPTPSCTASSTTSCACSTSRRASCSAARPRPTATCVPRLRALNVAARDLHRRHRRVLQQARRGPAGERRA